MTPQLSGRIQSRIIIVALAGGLWTLIIDPFLPRPMHASLSLIFRITFKSLGVFILVGIGWELAYHVLMQFRWDKDWPSLFGLLTMVNEGIVLWIVLHAMHIFPGTAGPSSPFIALYLIYFSSTWMAVWLIMQGPIKVLSLRWRYRGGRFF